MPKSLSLFLLKGSLRSHFFKALWLGLGLRILTAYFVYGPQALDDYKHGVWPAYQFFAGLPLDLPDYRSHLLPWTLGLFAHWASWIGITSALGQVRSMYMGLALVGGLAALYGTYMLVRSQAAERFSRLALYMVAAFPLMPFVSTRAFGEALAMSLCLLGFGVLENARKNQSQPGPNFAFGGWLLGFLVLGLATLFRFHVGVLYVTYACVLLGLRQWRGVGAALAAGLVTLAAQGLVDYLSGKAPLATLAIYWNENEGGGARYGVSPWYNTWLFFFAVALAPFSLVLGRHLKSLWRQHWPWIVPMLVFLTVHSLVAHKEERFLYPILGLELWALAFLWAEGADDKWSKRVFAPVALGLGGILLVVLSVTNTQEGEIEPAALTEQKYGNVVYLDHQSLFGMSRFLAYFLRPPSVLEAVQPEEVTATRVDDALIRYGSARAVVFLTSVPEVQDQLRAMVGTQTAESQCLDLRESGSWLDRTIYFLNPKHNQRRRPTWYLVCERLASRA